MPSTLQTIPTVQVFDYVYDPTTGLPVPLGTPVKITWNVPLGNVTNPLVEAIPVTETVFTDANGYWTANLTPNTKLNPANSTYHISDGYNSYDISVSDVAVPVGGWQSLNIRVSPAPAILPQVAQTVGALTVNGLLTATAGLVVSGGETETGGLTVDQLNISTALSKIVPGVTSLSLRNNANSADNVLVADIGNVTVRGTLTAGGALTVQAGGAAITGNSTVTGTLTTSGALTVQAGGAAITGNSTVTGTLTVTSTINGQTISAAANFTGTLTVAGAATFNAGVTVAGALGATGEINAADFKATGVAALANARAGRFVGAWTTFGPPTGLTAALGDYGFDGQFTLWVCTTAGSPGTWQTGRSRFRMRAHPSAATSVTSADVQITLGTVDYDPNGNFASSTYTVAVPGYYLVIGNLSLAAATDLLTATAKIYKNGVLFATGNTSQANGTVGPHSQVVVADVFAANDTIALFGSASSTTNNQTLTDANYLQVMYIGS